MESNILNLAYGQFESNGKFDIPIIKSEQIDDLKSSKLVGFNFAKSCKDCSNAGVHFFLHDYQFERIWNYPQRYIETFKKFKFILSPDFSPYTDMPKATKIFNVYRNRWCGRYYQTQGIKVIPIGARLMELNILKILFEEKEKKTMTEFKNIEKFENWLKSVLKDYTGDTDADEIDAWLEDVEHQYGETAAKHYEICGVCTKSGNSECYYYDVEIDKPEEDVFELTFIF